LRHYWRTTLEAGAATRADSTAGTIDLEHLKRTITLPWNLESGLIKIANYRHDSSLGERSTIGTSAFYELRLDEGSLINDKKTACSKLHKTRFPADRIESSIWIVRGAMVTLMIRDANAYHWYQRLQSRGWLIGDETSLQPSGDSL
jgi:hypothetical protein